MLARRRIGATTVSAIGFGCMGLSSAYGPVDRAEAMTVLHAALDAGIDFLDTADAYAGGHNESLIGEFLRERREDVVVATKFGLRGVPATKVDTSPEYTRQACEASLRRLGRIDLYYAHRRDPAVPIEDTVGALADLVAAGKINAIGLCEVSAETLVKAHAVHPVAAVQVEYSLMSRPDPALLAACRERDIAVVAYSPMGRGLLTGALTELADGDQRHVLPRFAGDNLASNVALADRLRMTAADLGVPPARLALAWVLAQGPEVVPIPGTTSAAHLVDNVAALLLRLSPHQVDDLARAVSADEVAGERYPAFAMPLLGN